MITLCCDRCNRLIEHGWVEWEGSFIKDGKIVDKDPRNFRVVHHPVDGNGEEGGCYHYLKNPHFQKLDCYVEDFFGKKGLKRLLALRTRRNRRELDELILRLRVPGYEDLRKDKDLKDEDRMHQHKRGKAAV